MVSAYLAMRPACILVASALFEISPFVSSGHLVTSCRDSFTLNGRLFSV
jgi:hypothetical protein